jgi:hypothetical protein
MKPVTAAIGLGFVVGAIGGAMMLGDGEAEAADLNISFQGAKAALVVAHLRPNPRDGGFLSMCRIAVGTADGGHEPLVLEAEDDGANPTNAVARCVQAAKDKKGL